MTPWARVKKLEELAQLMRNNLWNPSDNWQIEKPLIEALWKELGL